MSGTRGMMMTIAEVASGMRAVGDATMSCGRCVLHRESCPAYRDELYVCAYHDPKYAAHRSADPGGGDVRMAVAYEKLRPHFQVPALRREVQDTRSLRLSRGRLARVLDRSLLMFVAVSMGLGITSVVVGALAGGSWGMIVGAVTVAMNVYSLRLRAKTRALHTERRTLLLHGPVGARCGVCGTAAGERCDAGIHS
jgi:hypothetical protein